MKFLKGFYYAGRGLAAAVAERNFRFHLCAAAFVIFFAAKFYSFSAERWAILLLTCSAVMAAELVNTAIERLADKVTHERSVHIRIAKDCAAAAVLTAASFAAVIGVLLFGDVEVLGLIVLFFSEPLRLSALILALAAAWCFVFLLPNGKRGSNGSENSDA